LSFVFIEFHKTDKPLINNKDINKNKIEKQILHLAAVVIFNDATTP